MKYDLSSKITLEYTPERYYRSNDMIESLRQRRFEKLRTNIYKDSDEGSVFTAQKIAALIREKKSRENLVFWACRAAHLHWLCMMSW